MNGQDGILTRKIALGQFFWGKFSINPDAVISIDEIKDEMGKSKFSTKDVGTKLLQEFAGFVETDHHGHYTLNEQCTEGEFLEALNIQRKVRGFPPLDYTKPSTRENYF